MSDYTPTTATVRERFADGFGLNYARALEDFDRWIAAHDAEKRAEWEAEQPEGRRWYAACWQDYNGALSNLESSSVSREHAEADVKRWRAAEAKEEGGEPDRVILAMKISFPWLPVPDTTNNESEGTA